MVRIIFFQWKLSDIIPALIVFLSLVLASGTKETLYAAQNNAPSQELVRLFQKGDDLGFKKVEGPTYYTPRNLFEYINGGAELFLSYGFKELLVVVFTEDTQPLSHATLEVYNMGTLENAFGTFKAEAGGAVYQLPGGSEGRLTQGFLQFYKGTFYVKVFLSPPLHEDHKVIEEIAKRVEMRIEGSFSYPDFFQLLPKKGRVAGSEHYTAKDFLGQPFFQGIASAKFKEAKETYTIFISIKFDRKEAEKVLQDYKNYLMGEKAFEGELRGGLKGLIGQDPYYGTCHIAIVKGRMVGVLGNPEHTESILKGF